MDSQQFDQTLEILVGSDGRGHALIDRPYASIAGITLIGNAQCQIKLGQGATDQSGVVQVSGGMPGDAVLVGVNFAPVPEAEQAPAPPADEPPVADEPAPAAPAPVDEPPAVEDAPAVEEPPSGAEFTVEMPAPGAGGGGGSAAVIAPADPPAAAEPVPEPAPVAEEPAAAPQFGLYTYQSVDGQLVCHLYAPADQAAAQAAGEKITAAAAAAGQPPVGIMVLPLEPLPE